jgi:hypothetical protein
LKEGRWEVIVNGKNIDFLALNLDNKFDLNSVPGIYIFYESLYVTVIGTFINIYYGGELTYYVFYTVVIVTFMYSR